MRLRRKTALAAPPLPPLLCRWDLDKTYLRSEFDTVRQLIRTARERGEDKVEVPGVAELMKALWSAAARRGQPISSYFISASPPQIGKAIREKLALDGVPYDGIVFKNQLRHIARGRFRLLREHIGFKLVELFRGRTAAPAGTRELLFGDDWEADPITYSLYADVVAGCLVPAQLLAIVQRLGVDDALVPELSELATRSLGLDGVERIFINLERRTPPATFRLFGPRLVPTFNYFQTAIVLAADGWLEAEDVARVAAALVDRSGYTAHRLDNSLADLLRRQLVTGEVARRLSRPLRDVGLLPPEPRSWRAWLDRVRARLRPAPTLAPQTGPLDYQTIVARLRPETVATKQKEVSA